MNEKWHNINEEDAASLNFLYPFIDVYPRHFQKRFGLNPRVAMELKKDHVRYLLHHSFVRKMHMLYKWLSQKKNFEKLQKRINAESEQLHRQSDALAARRLKNLDDQQLAKEAVALSDTLCSLIGWGLLAPLIDFAGEHVSKAALAAIETQIKKRHAKGHPMEYFVTLTTPCKDTLSRQEERSMLDIAADFQRHHLTKTLSFKKFQKNHPEFFAAIQRHAGTFRWTYFGYCGPALIERPIFEKAMELSQDQNLNEKRKSRKKDLARLDKSQRQYESELGMDVKQAWAVHVARESVWLKIVRKDAMVHCAYALDGILREVARRTGIPLAHIRAAKSDELAAVLDGTLTPDELAKRHACVVYMTNPPGIRLLKGADALAFSKNELTQSNTEMGDTLNGICARPGKASGTVKIIDKAEQMNKMNTGDILVSIATTPEIVPAMKKAAAIVTEIGGITSHAAIVSRELGVPCVIGTKMATKWLNNGDQVNVDATEGIVRKISK